MRYQTGNTPTAYRYTGQRYFPDLELYFYNARWYDPALGRFVQPDTMVPNPGYSGDWDRYAYVRNNPLKYTDPTGHSVDCAVGERYCNAGKVDTWTRALDLAEYLLKNEPQLAYGGLSAEQQSILGEAGWSDSGFNEFVSGGNVSRADLLHDPLTYLLIAIGGGRMVNSFARFLSTGSTSSSTATAEASAANNLDDIADDVSEWLSQGGDDLIALRNKAGDIFLRNASNTRRIQFHLNDPSPHENPHMHLDWINNVGRWITQRIWPSGTDPW